MSIYPQPNDSKRNADLLGSILQGTSIGLDLVGGAASLSPVPYVSDALSLLGKIIDIAQAVHRNKGSFEGLEKDAATLSTILCQSCAAHKKAGHPWPPPELKPTIDEIIAILQEISMIAYEKQSRKFWSRIISHKVDPDDLAECRRRVQNALEIFKLQSHLDINLKLTEMISSNTATEIAKLREAARQGAFDVKRSKGATFYMSLHEFQTERYPTLVMGILATQIASGARHDSNTRQDVPRCLPSTGEVVFEKVTNWLEDHSETSRPILWVHGPAGYGKTTLAQSMAEMFSGYLGASFFWSKIAGQNRPTTTTGFIATLVYQLCQSNHDSRFTEYIVNQVDKDPAIFDQSLNVQLKRLVIDPLLRVFQDTSLASKYLLLLVFDGLDECEGLDAQNIVLTLLLAMAQTSLPLRILLCSRSERNIQYLLESGHASTVVESYNLITEYDRFTNDIQIYIKSGLNAIKMRYSLSADWPGVNDVDVLVKRSAGLFIYASVVMRYIGSGDDNPSTLLREMVDMPDADSSIFAPLDAIYLHLLRKIVPQRKQSKARDILHWMCIDLPMTRTIEETEFVLGLQRGDVAIILEPLASVICLPSQQLLITDTISLYFFHASFQDFLRDKSRLKDLSDKFWIKNLHLVHVAAAKRWITHYARNVQNMDTESFNPEWVELNCINFHCAESRTGSDPYCPIHQSLLSDVEALPLDINLLDMTPHSAHEWIYFSIDLLFLLEESDMLSRIYNMHKTTIGRTLNAYWLQFPLETRLLIPQIMLACGLERVRHDFRAEKSRTAQLLCTMLDTITSWIPLTYRLLTNEPWPPQVLSETQISRLPFCLLKDLVDPNEEPELGFSLCNQNLIPVIAKVLEKASCDKKQIDLVALIKERVIPHEVSSPPHEFTEDQWRSLKLACTEYITKFEQTFAGDASLPIDGLELSR